LKGQADVLTDEGGLTMLLGFLVLLLVLSEAFLVYFFAAISKDKQVTRAGLECQQFEMPVLNERIAYAAPSSGKVKDGLASESSRINRRKHDLAPGGIVVWTGKRPRSELKRQRGRDEF
jgi:hypothetical protein